MTAAGPTYGRYEIRDELGWGGFAMVYRAWDPILRREVALKALFPHLAKDPYLFRLFLGEAQALARLTHPNIVPVYDVGEAEGRPFFTMALVDGQTLAAVLASSKTFPLQQVIDVLQSLAPALDELHRHDLVHRDLKPQNVMLDRSGRVVLMDFGVARALDGTIPTPGGAILGTPPYMAPEQVRGERVTPAADIYALGVVTYHLLTGRPPFMGSMHSVLNAQVHETPPPLRDLRPDLPESVYTSIDAALAKEPGQRPASAGGFLELLSAPAAAPTMLFPRQSLAQALAAAAPGSTIRLRAGRHELGKGLLVSKPVTILGEGMDATELVADSGEYVLRYDGAGRFGLRGLTLRWAGEPGSRAHVTIVNGGEAQIEACRFMGAGTLTEGWAGAGLVLRGQARGNVTSCEMTGNAYGMLVLEQARPLLETNTCRNNKRSGIRYTGSAAGSVRQNTCVENEHHGISVNEQARPVLEGNACRDNREFGIIYSGSAGGTARGNVCADNGKRGIHVGKGAKPTLQDNTS